MIETSRERPIHFTSYYPIHHRMVSTFHQKLLGELKGRKKKKNPQPEKTKQAPELDSDMTHLGFISQDI